MKKMCIIKRIVGMGTILFHQKGIHEQIRINRQTCQGNEYPLQGSSSHYRHHPETMTDALVNGEHVEIRGFGTFSVKDYEGYEGRNPKTGEVVNVKPKKLPVLYRVDIMVT